MTLSPTAPARHLPLEGTFNLRDVGGYPAADGRRTRWRTLFRADSLHRLSDESQRALVELGLRTVVDLRRASETADCPNVFCESEVVRYRSLPVFEGVPARGAPAAASLEDVYRRALDDRQPQMRAIIGALAAPGALPAVVHCTAGKDRTGLVVALLLEVAGVSRETVVADYALTREYLTGQYFDEARERAAKAGYDWAVYQRLLECPPELMAATLAYLDNRYGGAADYLCRIGVTDAEIAALRDGLTEPMGETT